MRKNPPKIHQKLHLQHRQHTGRVLQHQHTSYRGLAIILILASAVIISLNILARATADTLTVYAVNLAPMPTLAATITSPIDSTVVTKSRLVVSGTCESATPVRVIAIMDNGSLAGSTPCQDDAFSTTIIIEIGRHVLIARTWTITNEAGPDSSPVVVFHVAEAGQSLNTSTRGGPQGEEPPLVVTIDEPFIVFGPAQDAIWTGTITGGTLPYQIRIGWGDGTTSDYNITSSGAQRFAHHYHSMQPHTITFRATDSKGRSVLKDYAAVTPYIMPGLLTTPKTPWDGSMLWGLYGAYLLLLVVYGSLWARAHQFSYAKVPVPRRIQSAKRKRRPMGH